MKLQSFSLRAIILLCLTFVSVSLLALPISPERATELASERLQQLYPQLTLENSECLYSPQGLLLAYVYHLKPTGYMVIGAREELPPLYAYSGSSEFNVQAVDNPLMSMVVADLSKRLESSTEGAYNRQAWQSATRQTRIQQWPPDGYSNTGGWVKTQWTQTYPYNMMCPMDTNTGNRGIAGCPAIAMGQIVNYHQTMNGTRLNDSDDYRHQYAGRNYWVDNDYATLDFPSFPQLNAYLDELSHRYRYQEEVSDSLQAALVFACGTALKQVYTSQGSGTFGVDQALTAFHRFGFNEAVLLTDSDPNLFTHMADNIKHGYPALLAVVTPDWQSGHNFVVDGYNENNYFHVNFGWAGAYDGWVLLPSQVPMGMTVVEGAVLDIKPLDFVLAVPDSLDFSLMANQTLELYNLHSADVVVEALIAGDGLNPADWVITPMQALPATIPANGLFSFQISLLNPSQLGNINGSLHLILGDAVEDVPVCYHNGSALGDETQISAAIAVRSYPNPSRGEVTFSVETKNRDIAQLEVFNIKGQRVFCCSYESADSSYELHWDGKDSKGRELPGAVYLYRITCGQDSHSGKLIKLK